MKGSIPVEQKNFDSLTKQLAAGTSRRRALVGLGALALGGASVLGVTRDAAADDDRRRCIEKCVDRGGNNQLKDRRERCRRKCQNR